MNKEIERFARDIMQTEYFEDGDSCENHICLVDCNCGVFDLAEGLYNAGYRKLTDHAIMVLRQAQNMEDKVRKETAKEIAKMLFEEWKNRHDYYTPNESVTLSITVNKICKMFGVEIDD